MFTINNFENNNNNNAKITEQLGTFKVVEIQRDLSVDHVIAQTAFYAAEMNVRRRQLVCDVNQ